MMSILKKLKFKNSPTWTNLLTEQCPWCGLDLKQLVIRDLRICESECDFVITEKRYQQLVSDMSKQGKNASSLFDK